ncbi:MAG: hypothetical protein IJS28_07740 [Synergistaceae bacterium]|nr:hypothetical protein [Synergistaceae bacterium]
MNDDAKVKRAAKNTVFLDLFTLPEYSLQMVQTLHPEMTDITEADIKILTLNPVILNGQYNDLALLVRDKLIIFVEAQSTWSINILVRILLYLSATYYEYIHDHELNVYTSKKLVLPEPEFYVIYTGEQKIEREVISLREDFWGNPDAKVDLQVRVIHAEDKSDVIGQYIIFCHVLDGQIKIHGRQMKAAEEAIRICQDMEVLRAYLESRKKEVIGIMKMLFDQDYASMVYGREQRKLGRIENTIEMCQDFGTSISEAIRRLVAKFGLSQEEAAEYVHEFWRS